MNSKYILFQLREAKDEIESLIESLEKNDDYSESELLLDITHIYHHINTAWNARLSSDERANLCSEEDFENWRQLPKDIDMSC